MRLRQKPNGMWLVDFEDEDGKRRRVSTGIKTAPQRTPPPDAKAAAREILLGIRGSSRRKPFSSPKKTRRHDGRLTVSELLDRCLATVWHPDEAKAQPTIRSNVKHLRAAIGNEAVEDITYTRIEEIMLDMKAQGYAPATIKRRLDMLSKALRMATIWTDENKRPLLAAKPQMPSIKIENIKDRVITPEEEEALFLAAERRRQTEPNRQWRKFIGLLRFLFDTGARLGEAMRLTPDDVTEEGNMVYVTFPRYGTKSGKPRTVPLASASVEVLGRLFDDLTVDKKSGKMRFFSFNPSTAWYMFKQLLEDVTEERGFDMENVSMHTIRHTTLTRLARGGMDLGRLQEWAGHSDPKITRERYVHYMPRDLDRGLEILENSNTTTTGMQSRDAITPVNVKGRDIGGIGADLGKRTLQ